MDELRFFGWTMQQWAIAGSDESCEALDVMRLRKLKLAWVSRYCFEPGASPILAITRPPNAAFGAKVVDLLLEEMAANQL